MSDTLSQEEINALLSGGTGDNEDVGASQDEVQKDSQNETPSSDGEQTQEIKDVSQLSEVEMDALGEIGNISMGSAATTMFTLLQNRVEITTPRVSVTTIAEIAERYPIPFISVFVRYSIGVNGTNLLILKEDDVKIITSLMMGGDGKTDLPEELTDLHLSAISEAMNQMMGASATSLAEMMDEKVDITPPIVNKVTLEDGKMDPDELDINEPIVCTAFEMTIGDIIDSQIMQILPIDFAKELVNKMLGGQGVQERIEQPLEEPQTLQSPPPVVEQTIVPPPYPATNQIQEKPMNQTPQPQYSQPQVQVQPAQFAKFDANAMQQPMRLPENIDLIKDVMLKITVELGKTVKPINEILDFKPGSIVELDKLVGESLDILANGKKIATGEVVVIDENYGMRITDIVKENKEEK